MPGFYTATGSSSKKVREYGFTGRRGSQVARKPAGKRRQVKPRPVRCDCGQIAITVITVRVGCNLQYTIQLPLCRECLRLEKGLDADP